MEPTEEERTTLASVGAAAGFCGITGTLADPKSLFGALVAYGGGDSLPSARDSVRSQRPIGMQQSVPSR
eukprot:8041692-Alexandrium_andersonii.AAC.1